MTDLLSIARFLWPEHRWKLRRSILGHGAFAIRLGQTRTLVGHAPDGIPIYEAGDDGPDTLQVGSYACAAEVEARIRTLGLTAAYARALGPCAATATLEEKFAAMEKLVAQAEGKK